MSATVTRRGPRKYQAWCDSCGDGINAGTQKTAKAWVDLHNIRRHNFGTEAK